MNTPKRHPLYDLLQKLKSLAQAHIYVKVSALVASLLVACLSAGWLGILTAGRGYAQSTLIEMIEPVTDSIKTSQKKTDSVVISMQAVILRLQDGQSDSRRIAEITIAAQRQADPRFDRAIKDMARAGELAKLKEAENRALIMRLTGREENN